MVNTDFIGHEIFEHIIFVWYFPNIQQNKIKIENESEYDGSNGKTQFEHAIGSGNKNTSYASDKIVAL